MRFLVSRPQPTLAEIYAELERHRTAAEEFMVCPISREPVDPLTAVLASDGYLYDPEALAAWAESCRERTEPLTSPVTREFLRSWAVPAGDTLRKAGIGAEAGEPLRKAGIGTEAGETLRKAGIIGAEAGEKASQTLPQPIPLPTLEPPFSPLVATRNGTQRVGRWDCAVGVACRMLLGWEDGDVVEWCFPFVSGARRIISVATPPPAAELSPLADSVLRWLGIDAAELTNPKHILTAWVRLHRPGLRGERAAADRPAWTTLEDLLLRLNEPRR